MSVTAAKKTLLTVAVLVAVVVAANAWLLFGGVQLGTVTGTPSSSIPSASSGTDGSDDSDRSAGKVWAIGDSLMVGATDLLEERVPGIVVDAERGRNFERGIDLLTSRLDDVEPDTLVVALGTNNGASQEQIVQAMELAAGIERVIFVNIVVPRRWEASTNSAIVAAVASYPNATFVNWYAEASDDRTLLRSDGFHLSQAGNILWVDLITAEILR